MSLSDRQVIKHINNQLNNKTSNLQIIQSLQDLMKKNYNQFLKTFKNISAQAILNYRHDNKASQVLKILKSFLDQVATESKTLKNNFFIPEIVDFLLILLDTQDFYSRLGTATFLLYFLPLKKWNNEKKLVKIEQFLREKTLNILYDKSFAIRQVALNIARSMNFEAELLKFASFERIKEMRFKSLEFVICGLHNLEEFCGLIEDVDNDIRSLVIKKISSLGIENLKPSVVQRLVFRYKEERCSSIKSQMKTLLFCFITSIGLNNFLEKIDFITLSIQQQSEIENFFIEFIESEDSSVLIDRIKNSYIDYLLHDVDDNIGKILVSVLTIEELNKRSSHILHEMLDYKYFLDLLSYSHPLIPHFFTQSMIRLCLCLDIHEERVRSALINELIKLCISYPINIEKLGPFTNFENSYLKLEYFNYFHSSPLDVIQFAVKTIKSLVQHHNNEFFNLTSEILNEITDENVEDRLVENELREELEYIDEEIYILDNELKSMKKRNIEEIIREKNEKLKRAVQIETRLEKILCLNSEKNFRMIVITSEIFRQSKVGSFVKDPQECLDSILQTGLTVDGGMIQEVSFECLTQIIIHNPELFEMYKRNFELALKGTDTYIEMVCLKSLFDIYMIYKPSQPLNVDIITHDKLLEKLLRYCHNFNTYIKALALEGFCKLIIISHIDSVLALTILIFAYFNTKEEAYIKQILHIFFSNLDLVTKKYPCTILKSIKVFLKISSEALSGHSNIEDLNFSYLNIKKLFFLVWNSFDSNKYVKVTAFTYEMDILYFYLTEISQNPFDDESGIYAKLSENIEINKLLPVELWIILKLLKPLLKVGENSSLSKLLQQIQERILNEELIHQDNSHIENSLKESYKSAKETSKVFKELFIKGVQSESLPKSKKILSSSKNSKKISVPK